MIKFKVFAAKFGMVFARSLVSLLVGFCFVLLPFMVPCGLLPLERLIEAILGVILGMRLPTFYQTFRPLRLPLQ
jgi:hypothetical protein